MSVTTQFENVGQITTTNTMRIQQTSNGQSIAIALLASHTPGAPVVDDNGRFVGFISEFDLLKAVDEGKDLNSLSAEDLMKKDRVAICASTSLKEATQVMEKNRLLNLPVEENGVVTKTVTRHDLLRALLGVDVGIEF
ncbi:MAG: CBS domain-containing protein [Nitrospirales bacterium]